MIDATSVARALGGTRVLHRRVRSSVDLIEAVEAGLPRDALHAVVHLVAGDGPEATELRHRIVAKTTLTRRSERLTIEESERVERLARMMALAEHVWDDRAAAREFMLGAQPGLGNERPVDLIRTALSSRRVEELLLRIEYSLPA